MEIATQIRRQGERVRWPLPGRHGPSAEAHAPEHRFHPSGRRSSRLSGREALAQVYEPKPGCGPATGTDVPLSIELGPDLLGSIIDGTGRPFLFKHPERTWVLRSQPVTRLRAGSPGYPSAPASASPAVGYRPTSQQPTCPRCRS